MKNFLQNLLMFLALCLCGLVACQWVRETDLRKRLQGLTDVVHDKSEPILNLEASVRHGRDEIQRLDRLRKQLEQTVNPTTCASPIFRRNWRKQPTTCARPKNKCSCTRTPTSGRAKTSPTRTRRLSNKMNG